MGGSTPAVALLMLLLAPCSGASSAVLAAKNSGAALGAITASSASSSSSASASASSRPNSSATTSSSSTTSSSPSSASSPSVKLQRLVLLLALCLRGAARASRNADTAALLGAATHYLSGASVWLQLALAAELACPASALSTAVAWRPEAWLLLGLLLKHLCGGAGAPAAGALELALLAASVVRQRALLAQAGTAGPPGCCVVLAAAAGHVALPALLAGVRACRRPDRRASSLRGLVAASARPVAAAWRDALDAAAPAPGAWQQAGGLLRARMCSQRAQRP